MDAMEVRMEIKRLIELARKEYPEFEYVGDIDELDTAIEALIHPEDFEIAVRLRP